MLKRNIVFVHTDSMDGRVMGCMGHPAMRRATPNLDRLAELGAFFDAAYCQMPLCTPSRMSMLTGRHSHRCGAWGNGAVLDPEIPTFASHLQAQGYDTVTVGKMHLGGRLQRAGFADRPYGDFGGPCGQQLDPLTDPAGVDERPGMDLRSRTLDAGISRAQSDGAS